MDTDERLEGPRLHSWSIHPPDKLYQIGLSAAVVLVLIIAYYLSIKAEKETRNAQVW